MNPAVGPSQESFALLVGQLTETIGAVTATSASISRTSTFGASYGCDSGMHSPCGPYFVRLAGGAQVGGVTMPGEVAMPSPALSSSST